MIFHYHEGMADAEKGEEEAKETIEEVFRSWHRENESESGVHLQFELEHGRSGRVTPTMRRLVMKTLKLKRRDQVNQRGTTRTAGQMKRVIKPKKRSKDKSWKDVWKRTYERCV